MTISFNSVIDLSHTIDQAMPVWPGDPETRLHTVATAARDGYFLQSLLLGEHAGTHFGASAHFLDGGRTVDAFAAGELIRPAVCIDGGVYAGDDPDFRLLPRHVMDWEEAHGRIPPGCVALMRTDRSAMWSDARSYFGYDDRGRMHFPAFDRSCAEFLAERRGVAGLGIDAAGIDAGSDAEFSVNRYWLNDPQRFHLENLRNLDKLPPTGITLMIGALKIRGGSGAPARVLGMI